MSAGHTPGPWCLQPLHEDDHGIGIVGLRLNENGIPMHTPTNGLVAIATQFPVEIDEGDFTRAIANARLIVAAPKMLEALQQIAENDGDGMHMLTPQAMQFIARAAIAEVFAE